MRGKLTRTVSTVLGVVAVVAVAGSREGPAVAAAVLALLLGGIALIQVGVHDPFDRESRS